MKSIINRVVFLIMIGALALFTYTGLKMVDDDTRMLRQQMYELDKKVNSLSNLQAAMTERNELLDRHIIFTRNAVSRLSELDMRLNEMDVFFELYKDVQDEATRNHQDETERKLNELYEEIDEVKTSATGGFGVLTGELIVPEPIVEVREDIVEEVEAPIREPIVVDNTIRECPSIDRSVNLGEYITKITFSRDVRLVIAYDISQGRVVAAKIMEGKANSRLFKALRVYLDDAIIYNENIEASDCRLPIRINV